MDRRSFLGMGLSGAAGVVVGGSAMLGVDRLQRITGEGAVGSATVPFHGIHQSGIETPRAAFATIVSFTLRPDVGRVRLERLLRLWSTDAALLQAGSPSLGDANPDMARTPASLTITIGLGHGAFTAAGLADRWPFGATAIPPFAIDRLEPGWTDGDLVLQVSANDGGTVTHAVRELVRDAQPFAEVRWQQSGWQAPPGVNPGEHPRNLLGFREGVGNPVPGTAGFASTVWNDGNGAPWFAGGTSMVVRRIRIDLDLWDQVPPGMQESTIGRYRSNGAPLGGTSEYELPNYALRRSDGSPLIPLDAHMRVAEAPRNIFRRPFNYDDGRTASGAVDAGLLFIAFGAEVEQYLTIQRNLAARDAMNRWVTPVGSALFALPPGSTGEGDWVGRSLFARR